MRTRSLATQFLCLSLSLLMAVSGWSATPAGPQLPDPGSPRGITREQQQELGLKTMAEVYKQMPVLPDSSPETQYIQQLGKKLVAVIPQQYSWPYQFHVIPQKEINAFALPGGPMFVNVGAITAADNEAQLVGVMAHEMSHVYMQHSAKQASKASTAEGLLGILGAVLGNGTLGTLARAGIQVGAGTIFLKYSRDDEAQADAVGAIIMYKAGYNPQAMAEFFKKLEKEGGGRGPQFLSDHPNPGNRSEAIDREIHPWPPRKFVTSSDAFTRAKQDASGIKSYSGQEIADGAKQGTWAEQNRKSGVIPAGLPASQAEQASAASSALGNVSYQQIRPSEDFTEFRHSVFSIPYPTNWKASGTQDSNVTIAPAAAVSQGSVAYGVVIGGSDTGGTSLDESTQTLIKNLEQSNPGMHQSGGLQQIDVSGRKGRAVNLNANSPLLRDGQPLSERDWLVTVPRPQGGLIYLVFIAPDDDFAQLRPVYRKMLDGLQLK